MKKSILLIVVLITFGIIGVLINLLRVSQMQFFFNSHNISLYSYKITVNNANNRQIDEEIIHFSPFDDYFYTRTEKDHFLAEGKFTPYNPLIQFKNKFNNYRYEQTNNLYWSFANTGSPIINHFQIANKDDQLKVTRSYSNLPKDIYAIGQSTVFCKDCFVIDDNKNIYFNGESFSDDKALFAEKNNFTPVFLTDQLFPYGVQKITIINKELKPEVSIYNENSDEMYYDEKWQLIEIKTKLKEDNQKLTQTIEML